MTVKKSKSKSPKKRPPPPRPPLPSFAHKPACNCGCAEDDHGHDPEYPGSTACRNCGDDCIAYDPGA